MVTLPVDTLTFSFTAAIADAQIYDKWVHYTTVWNGPTAPGGGQKAIDVVAVEIGSPPARCWLIEGKDFRVITNPPKPSNIGGLAQLVADKVRDSIAGLDDAAINATTRTEKALAALAVSATAKRAVLHLEPHVGPHSAGKTLMCRNPASSYRLLMKLDVDAFLKLFMRPVKTNKQT